jgi:SagB-type dehydrogenase family enzyme
MPEGVGAGEYHERTKHHPGSMAGGGLDFDNQPDDHKRYVGREQVDVDGTVAPAAVPALAALAAGDPRPDDPATRRGVDATTLRTLVYYAAGVTATTSYKGQTTRFRAASCTGALYHVDLYPVVGEGGPVPAGVYHFDPLTLSLDVLRSGDHRDVLAAASRDPRVAEAPVTLVAASEWWRNAWKYGDRTYRHAFWDSGTVLANLLATAHALDRPARITTGFADERVAGLLGLDTAEEGPLALVPVGAGDAVDDDAPADPGPIAPETAPLSSDPQDHPLIHDAYAASSLPDGEDAEAWRGTDVAGGVGTRSPGDGERVTLAPAGPGAGSKAPLHAAVERRRSNREFAHDDLNARKVATVLDRAVRAQPMDVLPGDRPLALNDCYLLVNAVEGIEAGAYQYHPADRELERLHGDVDRERAAHLALGQQWGGDAAVQVYCLADVDAVVDRLGDRGYRAAQLEAGLVLGRLYLATYAHRDLAGLGLTFFDDEVTAFFSPRAAGQTPTCLYAFGRPA